MLLVSQIPNMKTNCSTKCYVITAQQMHMFVTTNKMGSKFLGIPDPRKRERELRRRPVLHRFRDFRTHCVMQCSLFCKRML